MKLKLFTLAMLTAFSLAISAANTKTTVTQVSNSVELTTDVDYVVTSTTPFTTAGSVNIVNTEHAVLILSSLKPSVVISTWLPNIFINGEQAQNGVNCQVKMYGRGTIVFPYASDFKPLTCYTEQNFGGESVNNYTEGSSGGFMKTLGATTLNNKIRSFKLKRGYMVTFAIGTGGWGYSRCFIADQADLEVSSLPAILDQRISSYRIFKWVNAHKAGLASDGRAVANQALNTSWCYDWGQGNDSNLPDTEWVPNHIYEDWPSAATCGGVTGSCHMKTNNEPGNSSDDHPQDVATVLGNWQNLMRTGMRLCSESSHDGSMNHLKAFIDSIDARGWRCDILDLHCYWASGTFNSLTWYSDNYGNGRPIWISEWIWGASWNRNGAFGDGVTNAQILSNTKDLLTLLNNNSRVERYAYWNSESKAKIYDNGLTSLGEYYATMDVGQGYNPNNEFIPKETRLEGLGTLTDTYSSKKGTVEFEWTDPNGDLMATITLQCKGPGETKYTDVASITPKDRNSANGVSYTHTITVTEPGAYTYRVQAVSYNGKTFRTNDVTVDVAPAQGTDSFQYGKLTLDNTEKNTIDYSAQFSEAPCVFIGTLTNKNTQLKAGNVTGNTNTSKAFSYQLVPWLTNEGSLKNKEEVPFMALKAGSYQFDGLTCEVGMVTSSAAASGNTQTEPTEVTFENPFPEGVTPIVLTEIKNPQSYATASTNKSTLTCRIYDVTNKGFKYILYSEDGSSRRITLQMKVWYLAITPGLGVVDEESNLMIAAGHGTESQIYGSSMRENTFAIDTKDESGNVQKEQLRLASPVVFTALQTNNYPTVCMLRREDVTEKDSEGNIWVTGTKVKRVMDHNIKTEDGTSISSTSVSEAYAAYRDNMGWVVLATAKEGGTMPTAISEVQTETQGGVLKARVVDGRIYVDGTTVFEVFSLNGVAVNKNGGLASGIYVVKAQDGQTAKVLVP